MVIPIITKDPSAELDYGFDWLTDGWLATGETVITSTWTVPAGLTQITTGITGGTITVVWIGGGTVGTDYTLVNRIVTSAGRTDERSIIIRVRNR